MKNFSVLQKRVIVMYLDNYKHKPLYDSPCIPPAPAIAELGPPRYPAPFPDIMPSTSTVYENKIILTRYLHTHIPHVYMVKLGCTGVYRFLMFQYSKTLVVGTR